MCVCVFIYIYVCMYLFIHSYMYMYTYMYIYRERECERGGGTHPPHCRVNPSLPFAAGRRIRPRPSPSRRAAAAHIY